MINLKKILGRNIRDNVMYALKFLPNKMYLQLYYFVMEMMMQEKELQMMLEELATIVTKI